MKNDPKKIIKNFLQLGLNDESDTSMILDLIMIST